MKIVIDGVEYIAEKKGNDELRKGISEIFKQFKVCPDFFESLIKSGFAAYYHDEDSTYHYWGTEDGTIYFALEPAEMADGSDYYYEKLKMPDIREWNLSEFQEHIIKSNCIFQYDAFGATKTLLEHGAAKTCILLLTTGNLPE